MNRAYEDSYYDGEIKEELEQIGINAVDTQVGGMHYQNKSIQPITYIMENRLDFCEGNIIKYVTRWKDKNGLEDLKKAKHYLEFLIERETKRISK